MRNIRSHFLYYLTAALVGLGGVVFAISLLTSFTPAADKAIFEFDLTRVAEGEQVRLNVFGHLVLIRHRSPDDIAAVQASYHTALYPERDEDRLLSYKGQKDPRYIILDGYSGGPWCYPVANSGDFEGQGGWSCVSRGSHFDGSGRLQRGPGQNMKVPLNARLNSMTNVQFFKQPIARLD